MTSADLNLRLPLKRVHRGLYSVPSLPGVGIVNTGQQSWCLVRGGEAVPVAGLVEHPTLTSLHGLLADRVERARAGR